MKWYIDSCGVLESVFNENTSTYPEFKEACWLIEILSGNHRYVYVNFENNTKLILLDKNEILS